jgi:isoquinoline 1-oxidoreductase beta subunit
LPSRFSDFRITVRITERIPGETGRLQKVIEIVVDKSGRARNRSAKGRGFGFAARRRFLTYVATVYEVGASDDGEIRIPRVEIVLDAGLVVNPEATRAQRRDHRQERRNPAIQFQ